MNPGDKVRYLGCASYFNLEKGGIYTIQKIEIISGTTKLILLGIAGKYNSICFKSIL